MCRDDGSCAAAANVIYASPVGSSPTCVQAAPCNLTTAMGKVSATLNVLHLAPGMYAYTTPSTLDFNKDVTVVGRGATLDRNQGNTAPTVTVSGTANVVVEFVTITGGDGVLGHGITCTGTGIVTLRKTFVSTNAGIGVNTGVCDVNMSSSSIVANKGGGVLVANGKFAIVNNFITDNGDASGGGSDFGGVQMSSNSTTNVFEQNTVAYNHQKALALNSPGVTCAVAAFAAPRNIVTANNTGNTFPAAQTQGAGCTFPTSYIQPGSDQNDLKFVSLSAPLDLHLTAASPATVRDVAGVTACSGPDIDGDMRPQVGLCDFGADEYK